MDYDNFSMPLSFFNHFYRPNSVLCILFETNRSKETQESLSKNRKDEDFSNKSSTSETKSELHNWAAILSNNKRTLESWKHKSQLKRSREDRIVRDGAFDGNKRNIK